MTHPLGNVKKAKRYVDGFTNPRKQEYARRVMEWILAGKKDDAEPYREKVLPDNALKIKTRLIEILSEKAHFEAPAKKRTRTYFEGDQLKREEY